MAQVAAEQSELDRLASELARKEAALSIARKGLLRIAGINPITFPGDNKLLKAFQYARETADNALLNSSDAESPLNG